MSIKEIVEQFLKSEFNKDVIISIQSLILFITSRNGLNSTVTLNPNEIAEFEKELIKNKNLINYYN